MTATCLCCGEDAGYNRAVVDEYDGDRVGGLCLRCEKRAFGETLRRMERTDECCALCPRDGSFALPEWVPRAEAGADGVIVSRVDYRVDAATVRLCDRHLQVVAEDGAATVAEGVAAPRSRR